MLHVLVLRYPICPRESYPHQKHRHIRRRVLGGVSRCQRVGRLLHRGQCSGQQRVGAVQQQACKGNQVNLILCLYIYPVPTQWTLWTFDWIYLQVYLPWADDRREVCVQGEGSERSRPQPVLPGVGACGGEGCYWWVKWRVNAVNLNAVSYCSSQRILEEDQVLVL